MLRKLTKSCECKRRLVQPPGQALALIGSHGFLEIAVNGGNAQAMFKAQIGDRLTVILTVIR